MSEAITTLPSDLYEVRARVSLVVHESMGPEAAVSDGTVIAHALLGSEAWDEHTTIIRANSPEQAGSLALESLLAAGHDAAQVVSVKLVPDFARPAQILDVTAAEYHADPCPTPSLSGSLAKVLDARSPEHAYLEHPKLGGQSKDPTDRMDRGSLFHALMLGKGSEIVEVYHDDWRTNSAKALREAARAAGKIAVLTSALREVREGSATVTRKLGMLKRPIVLDGQSEVPIFWRERVFGTDDQVLCRCMIDHLKVERGRLTIYELKSTEDAMPDACVRTILNMRYHVSAAAYESAIATLYPEWAGRIDHVFIFAELERPFAVTPLRLDAEFRALGQARWDRAVRRWHECLTTGEWPGYVEGIVDVSAPPYALVQAAEQGITV